MVGERRRLDRVDVPRTRPGRADGEHAAPRADVDDDVLGADDLPERGEEGGRADAVVEHLDVRARRVERRAADAVDGALRLAVGTKHALLVEPHDRGREVDPVLPAARPRTEPLERGGERRRLREEVEDREAMRAPAHLAVLRGDEHVPGGRHAHLELRGAP